MRSMFVVAASAALLSLATVAGANEMSFGLQGGVSIPMGDYSDVFGLGPMGGVYGDLAVKPNVMVGLDVIGNFHSIKKDLKDELEAAGLTDVKLNFTVIEVGLHGKWCQSEASGPEVQVGVGLYNGRSKFEGTVPGVGSFSMDDSASKFGFSVGAGYKFWHNESMSLGLDGSFHNVTDAVDEVDSNGDFTGKTKSAQYVSVGLDLGFMTHANAKH